MYPGRKKSIPSTQGDGFLMYGDRNRMIELYLPHTEIRCDVVLPPTVSIIVVDTGCVPGSGLQIDGILLSPCMAVTEVPVPGSGSLY